MRVNYGQCHLQFSARPDESVSLKSLSLCQIPDVLGESEDSRDYLENRLQ
jgi:hypothetical protein